MDKKCISIPQELHTWLKASSKERGFTTVNSYLIKIIMYIKENNIKV